MDAPLRVLLIGNESDASLVSGALASFFPNLTLSKRSAKSLAGGTLAAVDLVILCIDSSTNGSAALLRSLRAMHAGEPAACPVIMLADASQKAMLIEAFNAGLDDYVLRSGEHLAGLPETVRLVLERRRRNLPAASASHAAPDTQSILDPASTGLARKAAILQAVGVVAEHLVRSPDWTQSVGDTLKTLGEALCASTASLFENHLDDYAASVTSERQLWRSASDPAAPELPARINVPVEWGAFRDMARQLIQRKPIKTATAQLPADERALLEAHGDHSVLLMPVFIGGAWWGTLFFGDCNPERRWAKEEIEALQSATGIISAAIQHKQVEEALRSTEVHFRNLVDQALVGIYQLDQAGRFIYANNRLCEITGYTPEEISGQMTIYDFCAAEDCRASADQISRFLRGDHGNLHLLARWARKDGDFVDVEVQGSIVLDNGNRSVIGTILDITERGLREREMGVIIHLSTAMRTAQTRNDIVSIVLEELLRLLSVEADAIALRDPGQGGIDFQLARGAWSGWTGMRVHPWEGVTGRVFSSGKPFFTNNIALEVEPSSLSQFGGLKAAACVPLIASQQAIGTLWVGRSAPFTDADLRLLTAISEVTANAINRATLNEQTDLRLQRLTALRAIDMAITASLDIRVTLNILIGQITTQLGIHAADVFLVNPYTQMLEYVASRGFHFPPSPSQLGSAWSSFISKSFIERQIVNIPDLQQSDNPTLQNRWSGEGFIAYYAVPLIAKGQVKGVLELFHREPLSPDPEWMDFLQAVTAQAAIAIDNSEMFDKLQRSNSELVMAYDATIEGWSHALELRDHETQGHTERVADLTMQLARAMQVPEYELVHIRRGVLLHDIGKMAIPDSILRKQGPLTDQEWEIMRRHPQYAYELLYPILYLRPSLDIPYCHHERWDGSGYPRGLKQDQIPLVARIFSVVDVWDALHHDRHYRAAWTKERSLAYIRELAGSQFDPQVVDTFSKLISTDL